MKQKEIEHIKKEIPIRFYDDETGCFRTEDGYLDIYQINPKDLVNSDVDEIEMDCFKWAKFYKTYAADVEIISMMFPCDTSLQQAFWKKKLANNKNPLFRDMISTKLKELEWREKKAASKEYFLVFFYPDKESIADAVRNAGNSLEFGRDGLLQPISKKKKEQILFKLANKNSLIFKGHEDEEKEK